MKTNVGIEALAVAIPHRYLALEDLARERGVDPAKYTVGLGGVEMSVPDPSEDAVALAATSAARLIRHGGVDASTIGMLAVGTETGVDHSKPVASHVQGLLGLPRSMRTFDTQHACYGGTAALMAAAEWIASGAALGKKAIVVCTDIARYELGGPGEPTQGAGAVAMLVSGEPKLLALDVGVSGVCSADVYDFWRPHGRREAVVDGHYSVGCYLDALSGAYRQWRARAQEREVVRGGALPSEQLARILYHVPFCKMARKAHAQLRRCDLEDLRGAAPGSPVDEVAEAASFERQVAPSLELCARVGNAYTASLYLALAGLARWNGDGLAGQRIGLFSYGSGNCAEFFSGVMGQRASAQVHPDLDELLARRERIDVAQYERLMRLGPDAAGEQKPRPGAFRLVGIREHRRVYAAA